MNLAHQKRSNSLVRQQRRLLRQLDSLSRAVTDIERDLETTNMRTKLKAKKNSALTRLQQLRDRMRSRLLVKKRGRSIRRRGNEVVSVEATESNGSY